MWLIHTEKMQLHQVLNVERTPYAILSHTWEDDEVTFQDFQDSAKAQRKRGYAKIRKVCQIATSLGLRYAWVDTCCIDKSSSAELSESINSMFKWYQASDRCIVFLSDLQPSPQADGDVAFQQQFPGCRWLTRGFTLQELIASPHVSFYDSDWNYRGTKSQWRSLISDTTGIDLSVLESPEYLLLVPVGRRMSWAAKRKTRREEDMAYCLLGLFDVNMPLIYGEGPKAFARLQEEIAKQTCDLSLFAWRQDGPDPPYRGILAHSPSEFVHCNSLKHRIRDADLTNEYTFTNKGLRMETALVTVPSVTKDYVWNLGCSERDDWSKLETHGYLGVFLAKTATGFVRVRPDQLFEAGELKRGRSEIGTFYMKGHVSKLEAARVDKRFEGAVVVTHSDNVHIIRTAPSTLWDRNGSRFLNHGQGINGYFHLELTKEVEPGVRPSFIVGFSTMERRVCAIWWERARNFRRVYGFMNSKVLADFVAADYLQLRFWEAKDYVHPLTSRAVTRIPHPSRRTPFLIQAELKERVSDGQRWFVLHTEVSRDTATVPQRRDYFYRPSYTLKRVASAPSSRFTPSPVTFWQLCLASIISVSHRPQRVLFTKIRAMFGAKSFSTHARVRFKS